MLLAYRDGNGNLVTLVVAGQGPAVDRSGLIQVSGVSQLLMAANPTRAGWLIQNQSSVGFLMRVSDLGIDAMTAGAFILRPGESFPPPNYPVPVGIINIAGNAGDAFAAREW